MARILGKEPLAPDIVRFWIEAPQIARKWRAGQFVIVRLREGSERIPLTVADIDRAVGAIALIVQGVGKTTRELNARAAGDAILDIAGPLGRPSVIIAAPVCCVAGGIGAAVVLPIAKATREAGGRVTVVAGARTKTRLILERELRAASDVYLATTDDGSNGRRGLVTDVVRELIGSAAPIDRVLAAGPVAMMRGVADVTRTSGIPTVVSLNPIMIDGTGMCGGCRVSVGGVLKFACVDGPEFNGHDVNFDELCARLSAFGNEERLAAALAPE